MRAWKSIGCVLVVVMLFGACGGGTSGGGGGDSADNGGGNGGGGVPPDTQAAEDRICKIGAPVLEYVVKAVLRNDEDLAEILSNGTVVDIVCKTAVRMLVTHPAQPVPLKLATLNGTSLLHTSLNDLSVTAPRPPQASVSRIIDCFGAFTVQLLTDMCDRGVIDPPVAAVTPTTATPSAAQSRLYVGDWIAILASVPTVDGGAVAEQRLADLRVVAPDAMLLLSDEYAWLNPGYWVVYVPGLASNADVLAFCTSRGLSVPAQCYAKLVA
jgi:hypothetical protein